MEALVESMESLAHASVWAALEADFRSKLGVEHFERWIAPLKVLSAAGRLLQLGAANSFVMEWVRKRYLSSLREVVRDKFGDALELELALEVVPESRGGRSAAAVATPAPSREAKAEPGPARGTQLPTASSDTRPELCLESFVVGDSNRYAYNAALEVVARPGGHFNPLYLFGPSGVGKTHLIRGLHRALRARRGANGPLKISYVTAEQFFQHYVLSIQERTLCQFQERYRSLDVLILDDVHLLSTKKKTQLELLQTFISLADSGRQVVLSSDVPPKELKDLEPDLVGRFASGLIVGMKRPDFATRVGIARAQGRVLSLPADESVYRFVAENVSGNARELLGAVKLLYHHAQVLGVPVEVSTAQEVLGEYLRERARRVDMARIVEVVASYYGVAGEALISASRERHITLARQVAMHLARHYTRKSLAEVGKYFGNRNHATVKSAVRRIASLLKQGDGLFAATLAVLREKLED